MARAKTDNSNFEGKLQQLDEIVVKMEAGNLSLEDALKYFEQGIALTRECQQALQQAEQKIQILMTKNAELNLAPFTADEDDADQS